MRLPIQSMQAVLLKPEGSEEEQWFRSVIVDFTPDKELVVMLPDDSDRVKEDDGSAGEATPTDDEAEGDNARAEPNAEGEPGADPDSDTDDDEFANSVEHLFQRGTSVEVELSFADGIRRFKSTVHKVDLSFGGAVRIAWPDEGTRIQRRDYVRVEAVFRVTVRFEDPESSSLVKMVGATMDLSAGGVRLQLQTPIPDDVRIEMDIEAKTLESQTLQGRVVRSREIERTGRRKSTEPPDYWVAVEFLGVDEAMRKEMTQLVFDIQRQVMRRSIT